MTETTVFQPPQPDWQMAEVNVARLKAPIGDPLVAPFVDALERVNAIAERMDGFVWRFTDDTGNATDTQVLEDELLIFNASVWRDVPSFERFVWGTIHANFFKRRAEWFHIMESFHFTMWWVPAGTVVSPSEAMDRLAHFNEYGPSETAFGWKNAPGAELWRKAAGKLA